MSKRLLVIKERSHRLSAEARRAAIVKAVRRVFAEKGFHGTTTKELARAAGVSEALLFKHFPTKEALYEGMQAAWVNELHRARMARFDALEPCTLTLVIVVYDMVSDFVGQANQKNEEASLQNRLMFFSLMSDGEFARFVLRGMPKKGRDMIRACYRAAVEAGEAYDGPMIPDLAMFFGFSLAAVLKIHLQHEEPIMLPHDMPREKLVNQVVWFILRGIGIKDEAIIRYYKPEALRLLSEPSAK